MNFSNKKSLGKKGFLNVLVFGIILFMFVISFAIITKTMHSVKDTGVLNQTAVTNGIWNSGFAGMKMFDYLFPFLVVGMIGCLMVSGFMIKTHPVFFTIMLFVNIATFITSVLFANAFESLISDSNFAFFVTDYPITTAIFHYLPIIYIVAFSLYAIVFFMKGSEPSFGGGGGMLD